MSRMVIRLLFAALLMSAWVGCCFGAVVSDDTDACLACHASVTPGIVSDWEKSRHALTTRKRP